MDISEPARHVQGLQCNERGFVVIRVFRILIDSVVVSVVVAIREE